MTGKLSTERPVNTGREQSTGPSGWMARQSEKVPFAALIVLLLIIMVMLFVNPAFLSGGNLRAIAEQSAVPVVVAVGLTFVILMGGIDLSVAGTMAAVSLSTALLLANDRNTLSLGLWVIPAACATGAALGLLAGISVSVLRVPSFIVTIGTWQIGLGVGLLLFSGKPPRVLDEGVRGLANGAVGGVAGVVWLAVLVVVIGWFIQTRTRFGRYAYVIGGSEETALLSGIAVKKYRTLSFVVAGATAGLAAVMATTRTGVGDVGIGSSLLFTTIAGIVIGGTLLTGGRGGVMHSVVGIIVIVAIANAMVLGGVSSYIQQAVQGVVVLVAATIALWRSRQRLRVVK